MKIKDIKTFTVGNPPPGWGGRYFTFVKLVTDNGITGIGECYCDTFGPKAMTAMIMILFFPPKADPPLAGIWFFILNRVRKYTNSAKGYRL